MFTEHDYAFMQRAIELAKKAAANGEVPVGAVLVLHHQIIGEGWNHPITQCDPTAHAEILALRAAAKKVGNYRLINTTLYVTLEPCTMCAAALVHSRIKKLVYGADDQKAGGVVSQVGILDKPFLNHRVQYSSGLLAEPCGALLSHFFRMRRQNWQ